METATFSYALKKGWSRPDFPALDSPRTLVLAFGATGFLEHPGALLELRRAYPRARLLGCSTSGEILGAGVSDDTLAVAVARFASTELAATEASIASAADSLSAGRSVARALARPDLRAVLVLSDGLLVNGSELVRGLNETLDPKVQVTGGLAGDGDRFQRTWVTLDGHPRSGAVVAVGLYGERVRVHSSSRGGWHIFGPERVVTRSHENRLFELDGRPALELYKQYLGEHAAALPASALRFPLALRERRDSAKTLVRTVLAVDEEANSMTFAGNVPEGSLAQLMHANLEGLIDGAAGAAQGIADERGRESGPRLTIAISCVGRKLLLGERAEEEVEAVLDVLPADQIGFYSYGEISPHSGGFCDLHNQTMTLTTLGEV
jgi:hypothetical protein